MAARNVSCTIKEHIILLPLRLCSISEVLNKIIEQGEMEEKEEGERDEGEGGGGRWGAGRRKWRYCFRTDTVGQRANRKTGDKSLGTKLTGTDKNGAHKQNQSTTWAGGRSLTVDGS